MKNRAISFSILMVAVLAMSVGCGPKITDKIADKVKGVKFPPAETGATGEHSEDISAGSEEGMDSGALEESGTSDEIETYDEAVAYINSLDKAQKTDDIIGSSFRSNKVQIDDMVFNTSLIMTFSEVDEMVKAAGYDVYGSEARKIAFDDFESEKLDEFRTSVTYKNGDRECEGIIFYFYCNRAFPDPDESTHSVDGYMPEDDDLLIWAGPYAFEHYWMEKVHPYNFPDVDKSKQTIYYPHGITYYDLYSKDELIEMVEGDGGVFLEDGDDGITGLSYSIGEWEDGKERTSFNIYVHEVLEGDDDRDYNYTYWYIFEEIEKSGKFGLNAVNGGVISNDAEEYKIKHES